MLNRFTQIRRGTCLLYTSDDAADPLCVELGCRRSMQKKTFREQIKKHTQNYRHVQSAQSDHETKPSTEQLFNEAKHK